MKQITPHLWYNKEAIEAAKLYVSVFPNSRIIETNVIRGTPSGDVQIVSFELNGQVFQAINGGPYFKFNPSISFMVNFDPSNDKDAKKRIDEVWNKLVQDGKILMPLDSYTFSPRYGWLEDKYGLSWQLILTNPQGEIRPNIIPSMLFVKDVYGEAEEASEFYISLFENSKRGVIARYEKDSTTDIEGKILFTDFKLGNKWFVAMDSALPHEFEFNEAISFIIPCESQEEIDRFWNKLSADPKAEQCGWCKDKYGVSWQIVPTILDEMMLNGTKAQKTSVTQVFISMKKIDIEALRKAYEIV